MQYCPLTFNSFSQLSYSPHLMLQYSGLSSLNLCTDNAVSDKHLFLIFRSFFSSSFYFGVEERESRNYCPTGQQHCYWLRVSVDSWSYLCKVWSFGTLSEARVSLLISVQTQVTLACWNVDDQSEAKRGKSVMFVRANRKQWHGNSINQKLQTKILHPMPEREAH